MAYRIIRFTTARRTVAPSNVSLIVTLSPLDSWLRLAAGRHDAASSLL